MTPRARDARRIAVRVAGVLAGATLLVGALHMPFARGLLMRAGGCPMAGVKMSAAQMDHARHMGISSLGPATKDAPARPALGFDLDVTTLADVHAWAAREHLDCEDAREALVKCTAVPAAALGRPADLAAVDELVLAFNPQGHLVNLTTLRTHLAPDQGAHAAQVIVSSLDGSLGVSGDSTEDFAPTHIAQAGAAGLASRAYHYGDYVADVTAMTLPASGLALREHYMSARD
jgi:hypothetical protein